MQKSKSALKPSIMSLKLVTEFRLKSKSYRVLESTVWTKIKDRSNEKEKAELCLVCADLVRERLLLSCLFLLWCSAAAPLWLFFLLSLIISHLSLSLSWKTQVSCRSPVWLKVSPLSSFIPQFQPLCSLLYSCLSRPQYRLSVRKDRVSQLEFGPWGLSRVMTYALTTEHFST